ncbi:Putative PAP-specific phosphatase, mitochondrial [Linum grandiflorum]
MNLVYNTITHFSPSTFSRRCHHPQYSYSAAASRRRLTPVRASLPFPTQKAKYYRELEAAVAIVERACRICVDVQSSLLSIDGGIVEKKDNSPVTVADFGVQGLISYELGKLFPSIPLVAEEDSGFVRANNLVDSVVSVVNEKTSSDKPLSDDVVLEAIDRGGSAGSSFGKEPATYWVLDPIDGTKGFLKGCGALYVVGLALVVEGEIVAGIMGCPNWQNSESSSELGAVMIAHTGCGTWIKTLQDANSWSKCSVDGFSLVSKSRFCIPESQSWKSLPLSGSFDTTYDADGIGNHEVHLMTTCCGSLCKYLMVASGRASVYIQAQREPILKVSDWAGSELDLAVDEAERRIIYPPGGILVTNGSIHKEILDIISLSSSVV